MPACDHVDHRALHAVLIAAACVLCAATLDECSVAAQDVSLSSSPEQLATAIARTMNATRPAPSAGAPITQQYTSRGSVVESRTVFKEANSFANVAARRRDLQDARTRYMCKAERLAYISRGVVFHEVMTGPDAGQSFDFTIDKRACALLASPAAVDAATLQGLTQGLARQLMKALPQVRLVGGSSFEKLSIQDELISVTYLMNVPAFVDYFRQRDFEVRGKTQGWFCGKFGDAIRQGVRVRFTYTLDDGSPLLVFPIDRSVC